MNDHSTGLSGVRPQARRWIWLAVLGASLGLAGIHLTQRLLILPKFAELEREAAEKDLGRCADAIAREVYHLDALCGDWAVWDNTYRFAQDRNQEFLDTNMDWSTLESISRVNVIACYRLDGERIWSEAYDSEYGGKIDVAELNAPSLGKSHCLLNHAAVDSKLTGLILTQRGPLLVSSRPVVHTDGTGPFTAVLIMGRFLDEQVLETLASQTKVPFRTRCLDGTALTAEEQSMLTRLTEREFVLDAVNDDELHGATVLADVQDRPALLLSVVFSREVSKRGLATSRLASGAAILALTLAGALIVLWHALRLSETLDYATQAERLVDERTAQLRQTQTFLEMAVAQSPSGILIADAPNVTIRIANLAALSLCAGEGGSIVGSDVAQRAAFWQVFRPDGSAYPVEQLPLSRAVLLGEATQGEELIVRDAAGKDHWVSANAAPIRDVQGRVTAGIVVFHDITARKQVEEEIQKAQRLHSVGTLAGGIAHDFNNMLMALYGNVGLAKEELAGDHPALRPLLEAEKSLNRAVRLTKQLLTFARGGAPVKEELSIGQVVEEVVRFDLSGSAVRPVFEQPADLWTVAADKGQVQQVISNLTINAREAMPVGGRLHVTLANAEVAEDAIPGLRPGRYVRIAVRDEGGGIDPKHLDRVFDPYFTTKHTGSGLGLATSYSIAQRHDGHLGVESALGQGSTFTLHLPASKVRRPEPAPPSADAPPLRKQDLRILVLDDEPAICRVVSAMLQKGGYAVETVTDGRQAIDRYRVALAAGTPFAALIMDLTIPGGLGGKEAIRDILACDPHAKALVSSGYADDPVMAHYADFGFQGVVVKPYSIQELLATLDRILRSPAPRREATVDA